MSDRYHKSDSERDAEVDRLTRERDAWRKAFELLRLKMYRWPPAYDLFWTDYEAALAELRALGVEVDH